MLLRDGYAILEQNYRLACGEIDLIAQKDGVIAFVEVKTRTGASREKPIDAVDFGKRQHIVNTAAQYLRSHRGHPVRFDVMEVYVSEREGGLQLLKTRHVKHVFAYDINSGAALWRRPTVLEAAQFSPSAGPGGKGGPSHEKAPDRHPLRHFDVLFP